ncbi:hypothetical protein CHLRE_04g217929v5 [Chlamydomonas reinhardtii]|uniref:Sulfite oxidase n=1 Tax=Chlamydomonas reinhardtii TaxID=3055 RepID=A8JEP4_CHLRE|nr:uncharacterized protein CHLRE_04g217929v5 [Chlamydomonas reinhardtii]PNW83825.1 hypothetical protein CHLRE_04g217929v5 [Chlamydomonas reinhardtii]|eukprot:XP_001701253.1 sulfite oxidase [Chlamydomonas reinhardtii]
MPQLNRLTRLRQPWVLPAASSALQLQQLNNLETTAHAGIIGERSLATKATATSSSRSESWSVPASILAAGAALLGSALLTPGQASAKKELAILPGSKPSPAAAPAKPAGAAASEPAAAKGPAKDEKGRPIYTREEVAKHKTPKDRVWVTYKEGVYDITEFIEMHPGGAAKIMLAAGGSVEPFWGLYQQHKKPEVFAILEPYRIGTLEGGAAAAAAASAALKDPYAGDPARHPVLIPRTQKPFNGETPGSLLAASPVTPTDVFFVRNHLPVPAVDTEHYRLQVTGEGARSLELSLSELQSRFRKHHVTATIQCSGNRRNEMSQVKPVKGLEWDQGAIGTAVWGGVRLRDVLKAAGLSEDDPAVRHIHFEGLDKDPATGDVYGASIPLSRALSPECDVLLAYEMNGAPLNVDHGAPLRVVVPGVTGARSVKWLGRIVASPSESSSHWQQRDYKAFCPSVDWDSVDWGSAPAIQEPPVTSAICEPAPGTVLSAADGEVTLRGYAWSGGGRGIVRVDVSSDGGKTWSAARLLPPPPGAPAQGSYTGAWAWTLWEATLPLPAAGSDSSVTLVVKAVDSSYNNQPDSVAGIWNLRGVVNNAWHRVTLPLEQ